MSVSVIMSVSVYVSVSVSVSVSVYMCLLVCLCQCQDKMRQLALILRNGFGSIHWLGSHGALETTPKVSPTNHPRRGIFETKADSDKIQLYKTFH